VWAVRKSSSLLRCESTLGELNGSTGESGKKSGSELGEPPGDRLSMLAEPGESSNASSGMGLSSSATSSMSSSVVPESGDSVPLVWWCLPGGRGVPYAVEEAIG